MEKGFEKLDAYPNIPIFYSQTQENPGEIEQIWHDLIMSAVAWSDKYCLSKNCICKQLYLDDAGIS